MAEISKITLPDGSEYNFKDTVARSSIAGAMVGASSSADGVGGLVPQPHAGDNEKYLRGDGTWAASDIKYAYCTSLEELSALAVSVGMRKTAVFYASSELTASLVGDHAFNTTGYGLLFNTNDSGSNTATIILTTGYGTNNYFLRYLYSQNAVINYRSITKNLYLSSSMNILSDIWNWFESELRANDTMTIKIDPTPLGLLTNNKLKSHPVMGTVTMTRFLNVYNAEMDLALNVVEPNTQTAYVIYIQGFTESNAGTCTINAITNADMSGATSSAAGTHGLVPAPAKGKQTSFLRGDGTWVVPTNTTYSVMDGASSSAAGASGLVPAPAAGKQTSFLRGDGTWVVPTNTTYGVMDPATSSTAGSSGLVPAPAKGKQTSFLRGDGNWVVPTNTTYASLAEDQDGTAVSLVTTGDKYTWNRAVLTSGTQNVGGSKTFTSSPIIKNSATSPSIAFRGTGQDETTGVFYYQGTQSTNATYDSGYFSFYQYSPKAEGDGRTSYYDRYRLPATPAGKTSNSTYDIYTEKNLVAFVKSGSTAAAGLVPKPSTTAGTTKFLCEDGTWKVPPDDDTTYEAGAGIGISGTTISNKGVRAVETGETNGTISVNTNGTAAEVAVAGLAAAAYKGVLDGTAAAALTTASTLPTVRKIRYSYYNGFDQTSAGYALDARAVNKLFILKKYEAAWTNCAVNGKIDLTGTDFGYTAFPSGYSPIGVIDYAAGNQNCVISFINARAVGSGKLLRVANYSAAAASAGTAVIIIAFAKNGAVDDSSL